MTCCRRALVDQPLTDIDTRDEGKRAVMISVLYRESVCLDHWCIGVYSHQKTNDNDGIEDNLCGNSGPDGQWYHRNGPNQHRLFPFPNHIFLFSSLVLCTTITMIRSVSLPKSYLPIPSLVLVTSITMIRSLLTKNHWCQFDWHPLCCELLPLPTNAVSNAFNK